MSIIGDKIHRIRDFRGMTQKQLGMAVGFDEKSADVRIAQYESGTRTPKQALVELLAKALDVNPRFLADDEILGAEGVMMMLFELDEHYPISIEDCEDEDGNRRKGIVFGSILMNDLLSEWQRRKKTLLTVRSARPNIQNGSLTGRKRPMIAVSTNLRKSGATYKPLEPQNNSA
jgi:transcriptional regulator with XRE-family HTH domain